MHYKDMGFALGRMGTQLFEAYDALTDLRADAEDVGVEDDPLVRRLAAAVRSVESAIDDVQRARNIAANRGG